MFFFALARSSSIRTRWRALAKSWIRFCAAARILEARPIPVIAVAWDVAVVTLIVGPVEAGAAGGGVAAAGDAAGGGAEVLFDLGEALPFFLAGERFLAAGRAFLAGFFLRDPLGGLGGGLPGAGLGTGLGAGLGTGLGGAGGGAVPAVRDQPKVVRAPLGLRYSTSTPPP